jgi:two-component system, sporulation sensor kinase E
VSFLEAEIEERDIIVELELDQSIPPLELDRDQVKQAFYNVIRNAFQAMKTGGILRIRSGADETHAFVVFADTGGGIDPQNISRLTEPYFTTKAGGTGLGLMIVKRIVAAHGGTLGIESTQGKGLTVTIRLPRADRRVRFLEDGGAGA